MHLLPWYLSLEVGGFLKIALREHTSYSSSPDALLYASSPFAHGTALDGNDATHISKGYSCLKTIRLNFSTVL